jgi:hypothetical protein
MSYKAYMAEQNDKVFQMRVSEGFLRRLDDWRREQPDIPSRADSIRKLVDLALGSERPRREAATMKEMAAQHVPEAVDLMRAIGADPDAPLTTRKKAARVLKKHD